MWFWIGLAAGILPFFTKYSWESIEEQNGQIVAFSYLDIIAITGGVVAMVAAAITVEANLPSIAKSALLFGLGLLQLSRGVALSRRVRNLGAQKQQREQQNSLPDKIEVPGFGFGTAEDAIRAPAGTRYQYSIKTRFMGTAASPGQDFLAQVPDHILDDEELQQILFGVYERRLPLMLLAVERGIDLDKVYEVYKRMAQVYIEHEGLDPRVPVQTILNSNALEYLLRRKATRDAILEVFKRFPEIASHREIILQSASGVLLDEEKPELGQQQSKIEELHEFILVLLEQNRFGETPDHADLAAAFAAGTQNYRHAQTLFECGYILYTQSQLSYAEPILRKSSSLSYLALEQKLNNGPELLLTFLRCQYTLTKIYLDLGSLQQAIDRIQNGIAQFRNLTNPDHMSEDVAMQFQRPITFALEVAAETYFAVGHNQIAQSLARAALNRAWELFGEEAPYPSRVQILLATIYRDSGLHKLSQLHFENAAPHAESHPEIQLRWASYFILDGKFDRAKQLLVDAADAEEFYANTYLHADWATMLGEVAVGESSMEEALNWKIEAVKLSDRFLEVQSARLSNLQFQQQCATQLGYVYELVDFVLQRMLDRPDAVRAACDVVLRRKLIESDAARHIHHIASSDPELRETYNQLSRLRSQIGAARLVDYAAIKYDAGLAEGVAQKERLEADLAAAVGGYKLPTSNSRDIEARLSSDTALVEYLYLPWIPATPGDQEEQPAHYVAFIIRRDYPCELVDIGLAPMIDAAIAKYQPVTTWRGRDFNGGDEVEVNQETGLNLREMILDPITQKIQACSRLIFAPDGELSRISIGALPYEDTYVIDTYQISYVTTGRDMLPMGRERKAKHTPPVVIADPDYDFGISKAENTDRIFHRLNGARDEGIEIAKLLGVDPVLDADATEELLKGLSSPIILHIATHAYYQDESVDKSQARIHRPVKEVIMAGLRGGGIALAGANTGLLVNRAIGQGADEGLVNADDVLEIDLSGTQLAVLSACETALGEVQIGQGVMGLRRSFVVAGVDTMVMSLWRVPDIETAELMKVFYREILQGKGCGEALVTAQQEFSSRDVYLWGAFICQGNTDPISSEAIAEIRQRTQDHSHASGML